MEENKKQFKIVHDLNNHTYTIWVQDDQGFWHRKESYLTEKGDELWGTINGEWEIISERILWMIDYWTYMDYEFIGIEQKKEEEI